MTIKHTEFKQIVWRPNKTVLNPNINPEVEYFSVHTEDYISFQPIVAKSKTNKLPLAFLIFKWMYTIKNKNSIKELFYYEADDNHTVNTSIPDNQKQEITKTIQESYKRFTDNFDKQKNELGIRESCPALDQDEVDQIYHDIINRL